MAERTFCILTTNTNLAEKTITIEFNLEIEEESISFETISLINKRSNSIEIFTLEVDGKNLILHLREWIEPGSLYTIIIHKGIQSIVGEILEKPMMRTLEFKQEVVSEIELLSPADFEKISNVNLEWIENGEILENRYYIEIAKENAFYNIIEKTIVTSSKFISLKDIDEGQYFVRIRAERSDGVYGKWSSVHTFIVIKDEKLETDVSDTDSSEEETKPIIDTDDSAPIIIEEIKPLEIEDIPVSGESPSSFLFTFSEDIDISDAVITVYRKDFN